MITAADLPDVRLESDLFTGPLVELWGVLFDLAESRCRMPGR
ncbi:hypothetical protein [Streptomyces sp. NPDC059979]